MRSIFLVFFCIVASHAYELVTEPPSDDDVRCSACEIACRRLDGELHSKPDYWKGTRTRRDVTEAFHDLCNRLPFKAAVGLTKSTKPEWHFVGSAYLKNKDHFSKVHESTQTGHRMSRLCMNIFETHRTAFEDYVFYNFDRDLRNKFCFVLSKACPYSKKHDPKEPKKPETIEIMHNVHVPVNRDEPPHNLHEWQKAGLPDHLKRKDEL